MPRFPLRSPYVASRNRETPDLVTLYATAMSGFAVWRPGARVTYDAAADCANSTAR